MELQLIEDQLTGGIKCSGELAAVLESSGAEDDRVILPESFFDTLNKQDAFSLGAAFFQLQSSSGVITHCGVREFTAMDDTIVLPQKVHDSLFRAGEAVGKVTIKYVRLPKVQHVKLQPLENKFFGLENVKLMLEDNLKHHSTLTIGDIVTVWHRGDKFTLKVSDIDPANHGTLIDTDVEVDLDESVEYKKHLQQEETAKAESAARAPPGQVLGSAATSITSAPVALPAPAPATARTTNEILPANSIPLDPEPDVATEGVINCKFRVSGGSLTRRFLKSDKLAMLFAFLRSMAALEQNPTLGGMCEAGKILQLTTRFPNRVIVETEDSVVSGTTLVDADIASPIDFIVGITA